METGKMNRLLLEMEVLSKEEEQLKTDKSKGKDPYNCDFRISQIKNRYREINAELTPNISANNEQGYLYRCSAEYVRKNYIK